MNPTSNANITKFEKTRQPYHVPLNIIKKKVHKAPIKYFLSKIRRRWPVLYQHFTFTCQDTDGIRDRGIYEKKNQEDISHIQNLRIL